MDGVVPQLAIPPQQAPLDHRQLEQLDDLIRQRVEEAMWQMRAEMQNEMLNAERGLSQQLGDLLSAPGGILDSRDAQIEQRLTMSSSQLRVELAASVAASEGRLAKVMGPRLIAAAAAPEDSGQSQRLEELTASAERLAQRLVAEHNDRRGFLEELRRDLRSERTRHGQEAKNGHDTKVDLLTDAVRGLRRKLEILEARISDHGALSSEDRGAGQQAELEVLEMRMRALDDELQVLDAASAAKHLMTAK